MDTILASIRRILNEDEATPAEAARERPSDDVLILESSMLAQPDAAAPAPPEPAPPEPASRGPAPPTPAAEPATPAAEKPAAVEPEPAKPDQPERREPVLRSDTPLGIPPVPAEAEVRPNVFTPRVGAATAGGRTGSAQDRDRAALEGLVAARTRAAAEQSFEALHAALRQEDEVAAPPPADAPMLLRSGGPSLEDLVRQELRGLLSAWLDQHLPGLVEALVRSQIEKIVRRGG
ncbi:DUF2497 domain-containing protein [Lichenicoccus sp.]|uniref:DUF2497 domain-containing protein n=1 Tax=Lichenicoccus sp. TaxID=2781899 RepID=UPI003D0C166C